MEESEDNSAAISCSSDIEGLAICDCLSSRRAADARAFQPDVTLTLGAVCPPGDVVWVGSVHRAYLDRSPGPTVNGWQAPPWFRRLLPASSDHACDGTTDTFEARGQSLSSAPRLGRVSDLGAEYGVSEGAVSGDAQRVRPRHFQHGARRSQRETARARLGIGSDEVSLLFVANELHRKGFGSLIGALAKVKSRSTRIDVVGKRLLGGLPGERSKNWDWARMSTGTDRQAMCFRTTRRPTSSSSPPCTNPSDWSSLRHWQVGFRSSPHGLLVHRQRSKWASGRLFDRSNRRGRTGGLPGAKDWIRLSEEDGKPRPLRLQNRSLGPPFSVKLRLSSDRLSQLVSQGR